MNETEDCKDLCDINYQPILAFENILVNTFSTILDKDLRTEYLINGFGQILYSQFIGKPTHIQAFNIGLACTEIK